MSGTLVEAVDVDGGGVTSTADSPRSPTTLTRSPVRDLRGREGLQRGQRRDLRPQLRRRPQLRVRRPEGHAGLRPGQRRHRRFAYWYTEGATHVLYIGTASGKIVKLVDNGASLTTTGGYTINGPTQTVPFIAVTSPIVADGTNIYFGAKENATPKYRTYAHQMSNGAQIFALAEAATAPLTTFPAVNLATTTHLYMGSDTNGPSGHVYRINVNTRARDLDYTTSYHFRAAVGLMYDGVRVFVATGAA